MSLSGEEEQHGVLRVVHNAVEAVEVGEQKVCTFICCETPAEAYHQCIGIDTLKQRHHTSRVTLITKPLRCKLITDISNKFLLQGHTGFPYLFIRYLIDGMPDFLVTLV